MSRAGPRWPGRGCRASSGAAPRCRRWPRAARTMASMRGRTCASTASRQAPRLPARPTAPIPPRCACAPWAPAARCCGWSTGGWLAAAAAVGCSSGPSPNPACARSPLWQAAAPARSCACGCCASPESYGAGRRSCLAARRSNGAPGRANAGRARRSKACATGRIRLTYAGWPAAPAPDAGTSPA